MAFRVKKFSIQDKTSYQLPDRERTECLYHLEQLAEDLGFKSSEIEALRSRSMDSEIAQPWLWRIGLDERPEQNSLARQVEQYREAHSIAQSRHSNTIWHPLTIDDDIRKIELRCGRRDKSCRQ